MPHTFLTSNRSNSLFTKLNVNYFRLHRFLKSNRSNSIVTKLYCRFIR